MRLRAMVGGVAALVAVMASGALGQHGTAGGGDEVGAGLTKQERIAQAVAELNAQAVEPVRGESVTGGQAEPWDGVAARTVWNDADVRGIGGGCSIDVALVFVDGVASANDVQAKLLADFRIASVTQIDAGAATPTLGQLRPFDAVMVYTDGSLLDGVTLGDALAAYVDAGGGVVLALFAIQEAAGFPGTDVEGRFLSDNYFCIERSVGPVFGFGSPASLGAVLVPGHPTMLGVGSFSAPTDGFRSLAGPHPRASVVARWNTGEVLVAVRDDLAGRRVDLGMFPVSNTVQSNGWDAVTDGDRLMSNAVVYASGCPGVGLQGCGASRFRLGPDLSLASFNSNTPVVPNDVDQKFAYPFAFGSTTHIGHITLWGTWWGDEPRPQPAIAQRFVVNIHQDAGGLPGPIVYTTTVNVAPEWVGERNSVNNRVYRFSIDLPETFTAFAGATYWLSPLGDVSPFVWSWQFRDDALGNAAYMSDFTTGWEASSVAFAFELCGFCDCLCPGDADFDGDVDLDDLQLLLFWFGSFCL